MQVAPLPAHEAARLSLLNSLNILDTGPESHYDRITAMAARLLGMPISLVSLIDHDRQWFKSRFGLGALETPRDSAFCAHAILTPDTFVVPDAKQDVRFHDNPLVTGAPHVRFYAGAPLTSLDGVALGTLCVIDVVPRQFSAEEDALLRDLAAVVSRELGHRELALRGQGDLLFQLRVGHDGRRPQFTFMTAALAGLVGASPEALHEDVDLFLTQVHPLDQEPLLATLTGRRLVEATSPQGIGLRFRLLQPGRRKPTWLLMRAEPRPLPGGDVQWTGNLADISLEREVEYQQRETDRLRATTAMVTGVAHDFNNILASMIGLAELCRDDAEVGTRQNRNLGNIVACGHKAASLIRQMLDYARQSPLELQPAWLGDLICELLPLVRVTLQGNVALVFQAADDAHVLIDAPQFEQVAHNLIVNAADAMQPDGGEVRISVDRIAAAASPLDVESVRLVVADSGCGIASADIGRVFDPFFTTKPVGSGTGLGLSSAQGIVVSHGGLIEVESVVGQGSAFSVWLPVLRAGAVACRVADATGPEIALRLESESESEATSADSPQPLATAPG